MKPVLTILLLTVLSAYAQEKVTPIDPCAEFNIAWDQTIKANSDPVLHKHFAYPATSEEIAQILVAMNKFAAALETETEVNTYKLCSEVGILKRKVDDQQKQVDELRSELEDLKKHAAPQK